MIIAITGASGFVGQLLAKYHINQGDEVRYLTRTNHRNIHGAIPFISHVNASYEVLLPFLQMLMFCIIARQSLTTMS